MPKDDNYNWEDQVGARRYRLRPRDIKRSRLVGLLVSQLAGLGALALVTLFFNHFDWNKMSELANWTGGVLGFSQFLLIPFGMGFVAAYFWFSPEVAPGKKTVEWKPVAGAALINTAVACLSAALVLREGAICLVMVSPLLWIFMSMGLSAGQHFWRVNPMLSVSLVPIFLLIVFAEAGRTSSQTFAVTTRYHSSAAPQTLWRYTANYPRNLHPPRWWLYRIGLPAPMQSNGAPIVGGRRDCELSGGVTIGEKIVVAEPSKQLEFVIDRQPQHPEITRHFVLERGRIELAPDGRGGTWLTGTSWYHLNVAPVGYFNWWSAQVVHQTHERVFSWMDELAHRDEVTKRRL